MKMALASVIKASASAAPERNRIRNTSAVLRKLSLNAAKNWHQNSGAKLLEKIGGGGIAAIIEKFPRGVAPRENKNGRSRGRPRLCSNKTQRQRNYRRNFPPMVESRTIAAMLKAMAIAMVMANSAIHMA